MAPNPKVTSSPMVNFISRQTSVISVRLYSSYLLLRPCPVYGMGLKPEGIIDCIEAINNLKPDISGS